MRMDDNSKRIVKESMKMLIDHAELYLDIVSNISKIKKEEESILPNIF
jgi:hypothetical protein